MLPLAPVVFGLVAGVEETLQVLSPYRSASVKDLAADILGILFFLALDRWLKPDSSPPERG